MAWLHLKELKVLNDEVGNTPVVIVIASDEQSFAAFKPDNDQHFILRNDSLISGQQTYDFHGRSDNERRLAPVKIYQEFWHSWRQFHPDTETFNKEMKTH